MKKNTNEENTRKTIYLRRDVADKITEIARMDNRTFSKFVAILLEEMCSDGRRL